MRKEVREMLPRCAKCVSRHEYGAEEIEYCRETAPLHLKSLARTMYGVPKQDWAYWVGRILYRLGDR